MACLESSNLFSIPFIMKILGYQKAPQFLIIYLEFNDLNHPFISIRLVRILAIKNILATKKSESIIPNKYINNFLILFQREDPCLSPH